MSASALEETRERLAQCFSYIKDVAEAGGSAALDSAPILALPALVAPPDPTAYAPVPEWLLAALASMRKSYILSEFVAVMTPDGAPMIICFKCPGTMYPPGPGKTVHNFRIHFESGIHEFPEV